MKLNNETNSFTKNDKEKAEVLDKLFSSVFTNEGLKNMPSCKPGEKSKYSFFSDIILTEEAVKLKLKKLNPNKTPGQDNIHPKVLVELSDSLAKPLCIFFNKSLQANQLPKEW